MLLAVDPGRMKCGWALADNNGGIRAKGIWPRQTVLDQVTALARESQIDLIIMGDRTGHQDLHRELSACPSWRGRILLVDEDRTSQEARLRCVRETARGWRRLIPATLQSPKQPYDDYVALILVERFLQSSRAPARQEQSHSSRTE